jgi:hypothetical protein
MANVPLPRAPKTPVTRSRSAISVQSLSLAKVSFSRFTIVLFRRSFYKESYKPSLFLLYETSRADGRNIAGLPVKAKSTEPSVSQFAWRCGELIMSNVSPCCRFLVENTRTALLVCLAGDGLAGPGGDGSEAARVPCLTRSNISI